MVDIKKLPLHHILSEDGMILLWTTNPMKANAIKVLEHNKCTYV